MATSYRQILVHLDSGRRIAPAVQCARRIAQEQGAALAAIDVARPALTTIPDVAGLGGLTAAALVELEEERRKFVRDTFDQAMANRGPAARFGEMSGFGLARAFAHQAFHADLLVLSQPHPDTGPGEAPHDFNEDVMAASGKPALVLPAVGQMPESFRTVVIAWKPAREAAAAVNGAMPLLQRAAKVHIVAWGSGADDGVPLNLDGYLRSHGVAAQWHLRGDEPAELGQLLLSQAFDLGADLLVMGCYGHGRAREWVMGGVSRTVLRSMTLPVLMAN
jgi:nucleotide-binding universal stress UspA family protein